MMAMGLERDTGGVRVSERDSQSWLLDAESEDK